MTNTRKVTLTLTLEGPSDEIAYAIDLLPQLIREAGERHGYSGEYKLDATETVVVELTGQPDRERVGGFPFYS